MSDTVNKLLAQLNWMRVGISEVFLFASSTILSSAIITILHSWADVPLATATLAVLGGLSLLVVGNALVRWANTPSIVGDKIAELHAEIAALRSARLGSARGASTIEVGRADGAPRRYAFRNSVILASAQADRPTPLLPAPPPNIERDESRSAKRAVDVAAAAPARSGPMQSSARSGPSQVQSAAVRLVAQSEPHQSAAAGIRPASPTRLAAEARHGWPNVHAAHHSRARVPVDRPPPIQSPPHTDDKISSGALDLEAMQALIEQLAAQRQQSAEADHASLSTADQLVRRGSWAWGTTAASIMTPKSSPAARIPVTSRSDARERDNKRSSVSAESSGEVTLFGHVTQLSEALEAKRMEVFLNPLVGLGDRKARHLELSVRLVAQSGHAYAEDELRCIAAGTGLLARVDAAKLARALAVLSRFRSNGSRACVFAGISGESLVDENFAGALATLPADGPADDLRLVLALPQAEARTFSGAHWHTITEFWMRKVTFALTDVTDLDIDFELLKSHGFEFIKLDATVFIEGLPTPGGHVPATDICRHLAGLGLNPILGETAE